MTVHRIMILALAAPAVLAGPGRSQEPRDTFRLSDVVVTPTRIPTPRSAVPVSVTVISGEELRARGVHQVLDALRDVTGAAVAQVGGFGGVASLFLRGGESDYVTVLLDGVPLNQPGGAVDLGNLTTESLDRIEIVRGPASVLYGSDAMTGVVHLISTPGEGDAVPSAHAAVRAGAYRAADPAGLTGSPPPVNHAVTLSGRVAGGRQTRYGLAFQRSTSNGLLTWDGADRFDNRHSNTAVSGKVRVAPDGATHGTLSFRYGDHRYHYPTDGAGRLVDHNAFTEGRSTVLALDAGRRLRPWLDGRLLLTTHVNRVGVDDQADGPADTLGVFASESQSDTERRRAEVRGNVFLGRHWVVTLGALVEQEWERGFSSFTSSFGASAADADLHRSSRASFVQVQTTGARTSANLGARVEGSSAFGRFTTYRGAAGYWITPSVRLRAAGGTGFKAPTFFENFATGFVRGNASLRPERSVSGELGADLGLAQGRATLTTTVFAQQFQDLIDFTFTPPVPSDPNYFNIVGANAAGLEVEARALLAAGWTVAAGYTYLRARVTQGGFDQGPGSQFAPGAPLLRRPAHSAVLTAVGPVGRARIHGGLRYHGPRADRDFAAFPSLPVELAPYIRVDLGTEVDLTRGSGAVLSGSLRLENLLGAEVRDTFNFPARGRTLWAGLHVNAR